MGTNTNKSKKTSASDQYILTKYTLLDRHNKDPIKRRVESKCNLLHSWHNLKRGMPMPEDDRGNVIVGFWRGNGGMYASYGPSIHEVCGWTTIKAAQAKKKIESNEVNLQQPQLQ